jgi:hypothetical protein
LQTRGESAPQEKEQKYVQTKTMERANMEKKLQAFVSAYEGAKEVSDPQYSECCSRSQPSEKKQRGLCRLTNRKEFA